MSVSVPAGYRVHETPDPVEDVGPMRCRTRWGACRVARRMNAARGEPSYRWEIFGCRLGLWEVRPMQNVLVPVDPYEQARALVDDTLATYEQAFRDFDAYVRGDQ